MASNEPHRFEGGRVDSWLFSDFKSIESAHINSVPLTILAGANSSGKSSILQSLMFLAQSAGEEEPVLNGPLVRLGEPRDVIRSGASAFTIGVAVRASNPIDDPAASPSTLRAEISFEARKTDVRPTFLSITDSDRAVILEASGERIASADSKQVRAQTNGVTTLLRVTTLDGRTAPSRTYVGFASILPEVLVYRQSRAQVLASYRRVYKKADLSRDAELMRDFWVELYQATRDDQDESARAMARLARSGVFAARGAQSKQAHRALDSMSAEQFSKALTLMADWTANTEWAVLPITRTTFSPRNALTRGWYQNAPSATAARFSGGLRAAGAVTEALRRMAFAIRYLGPLREEPQVLSAAVGGRYRALPVGSRGEFTAQVLAHRRGEVIEFADWTGRTLAMPLPEAVSLWTNYLGVGEAVGVLDQGKLGRGLRVRVHGVDRDLTTIGVGASQLLPVVVAVLSVPSNSFVLLEQPELHLHPAVQSRLADFFLFARPNVRFVIETHSEYLITRLRRRVAEGVADPGDVNVLFAEQDDLGTTRVRPLPLTSFGDLVEWPQGFFDAQDDDSRHIIRAVTDRLEGRGDHGEHSAP